MNEHESTIKNVVFLSMLLNTWFLNCDIMVLVLPYHHTILLTNSVATSFYPEQKGAKQNYARVLTDSISSKSYIEQCRTNFMRDITRTHTKGDPNGTMFFVRYEFYVVPATVNYGVN